MFPWLRLIAGGLVASSVLLTADGRADAATDLSDYLAARGQAFATLADSHRNTAADEVIEAAALSDLEGRLRRIIGPIGIPGFPEVGTNNLETLSPEIGLGKLDGLKAQAPDGTAVWVTTLPLLRAWLADHRNEWRANPPMSDVAAAFRSDDFYTFSISSDVHADIYTELPLAVRPGDEDVTALLILYAQDDDGPYLPEDLVVALVREGRAIIFRQPVKLTEISECRSIWERENAVAEAVLASSRTVPVEKEVFERYSRLDGTVRDHFVRCFRERLKSTPDYAVVIQQAQALLDRTSQR